MGPRSVLFFAALAFSHLHAQDCASGRYVDPSFFQGVSVTPAVVFGSNTAVSGGTQTLRMDVYEPEGDLLTERPVVLVAFGGSFITGTRADVASICEAFARRGYVAIAPDYRVGFFLPNEATTTRAVMRGAHDMKACVRYLRMTVENEGNPFGIDQDRIIVGGVSAGAISALHCTYLDQPSEIPSILAGESAALGGVEGNSGNPGFTSEVMACYSFSGALGDTLYVEPGDQPLVSVHEIGDGIVPYYTQEVSVIGIQTGLVASGSHDIHVRMDNLSIANCLLSYPGNAHVGYLNTDAANAIAFVADFLSDIVCGLPTTCGASSVDTEDRSHAPIHVHPNPTNGIVSVEIDGSGELVVVDVSGRIVLSTRYVPGVDNVDLTGLPDGVYFVGIAGSATKPVRVIKSR